VNTSVSRKRGSLDSFLFQSSDYATRYASGRGGDDASENGPTGHAYTAAAVAERERRKGLKDRQSAVDEAEAQKEVGRCLVSFFKKNCGGC
jgi:hypothetical protein